TLRCAGKSYRLDALWAGEGWPGDVRQILAPQKGSWPRHQVVMARRLSPGALSLLQERDANWADEAGQTRLVVPPGLLIVREPDLEGTPSPKGFRWSPSAIHLAEVALATFNHSRELRTGELADETTWSPGQVSNVMRAFDSLGWTVRHGGKSGRRTWRELSNPGAMLDSWARQVGTREWHKLLGHHATRDLMRFAEMTLRDALGWDDATWALTTWAGLEAVAPFVSVVPVVQVYVSAERFAGGLGDVFRSADLREVEDGARVEFWEADFRLVTQQGLTTKIPVASTPRLYADLFALGGRGTDAAQHLRETKLDF
ncbi:MAG: type IV toxin-antitoxin system AbiEi family antitoxin, partial [bacterium]